MWRSVRGILLTQGRAIAYNTFFGSPLTVGYGPFPIATSLEAPIMFEQLFRLPAVVARHRTGPFADARERFLRSCAENGMTTSTLWGHACHLLEIAKRLDIDGAITQQEIESVADRWGQFQRRKGRSYSRKARQRVVQITSDWLRFLGRLPKQDSETFVGIAYLRDFTAFMAEQRGLSAYTIHNCQKIVTRFLKEFSAEGRPFASLTVTDIDHHLESLGNLQWRRTSIATTASELRSFFRYVGEQGWCSPAISAGIRGPRIYKHEVLAGGPAWTEVERLVLDAGGNSPKDIRDQAILRLLATYALRRGEVCRLRLEDIDWAQDRLMVQRSKQRRAQEYPLLPSVGEAITHYLREVRPKSSHREIFLTLRAPIVPILPDGLYDIVHGRLKARGIVSPRRGPHALRHACATRLVAQGLSLKEIGDHLGHRRAMSTRVYAKVDLAGLREAAAFNLGDLL
jgi:integrase/recombinase XerD